MLSNATILAPKCAEVSIFTCKNCNKQFKHSPSLSRHKKTCSPTEVINNINTTLNEKELHRPERKMRQNAVIICISYNYVSSSLLNVPLLFSFLKYLKLHYKYLDKYLDFPFLYNVLTD